MTRAGFEPRIARARGPAVTRKFYLFDGFTWITGQFRGVPFHYEATLGASTIAARASLFTAGAAIGEHVAGILVAFTNRSPVGAV